MPYFRLMGGRALKRLARVFDTVIVTVARYRGRLDQTWLDREWESKRKA